MIPKLPVLTQHKRRNTFVETEYDAAKSRPVSTVNDPNRGIRESLYKVSQMGFNNEKDSAVGFGGTNDLDNSSLDQSFE